MKKTDFHYDLPAELMVAYAYDLVNRGNQAGFFGMVFVLEGTSVALALAAADQIQQALGLPDAAFSYLRSHGTLDQEHTKHLANLLEKMTTDDQAEVLRCAKIFRIAIRAGWLIALAKAARSCSF